MKITALVGLFIPMLASFCHGQVLRQSGSSASSFNASTVTATTCLRAPADGTAFIAGPCVNDRVGIGTASPAYRLQVNAGDSGADANFVSLITSADGGIGQYFGFDTTANFVYWRLNDDGTYGFQLQTASGAADLLTIENGGDTGINDASPDGQLEVLSKSAATGFVVAISSQNDTTGNILAIKGNGDVGIGVTSPGSKLDVNGNIRTNDSASVGLLLARSETQYGLLNTDSNHVTLTMSNSATFDVLGGNTGFGDSSPDAKVEILSNAKPTGYILAISSQSDVVGNIMGIQGNGAVTFGADAPVTISSAAFVGVYVSTQAAGAAGASVTASCPAATFAIGGGCECSGAVAVTGNTDRPNCVTQGCIANGWTCQETGGTGGACSAYAVCSRLQ